jgi:hypothetical protein
VVQGCIEASVQGSGFHSSRSKVQFLRFRVVKVEGSGIHRSIEVKVDVSISQVLVWG